MMKNNKNTKNKDKNKVKGKTTSSKITNSNSSNTANSMAMILNKLVINNIGPYKGKVELDLSQPGIYLIKGNNLDIKKNNKEQINSNNGAGKSLLMSSIYQLLYNTMPNIKSAKALINNVSNRKNINSYIKLDFELPNFKSYKNKRQHKKNNELVRDSFLVKFSNNNYNIKKNKKDISAKNKKDNVNLLMSLLPFTQKEYMSFIHITPNNPFPLLYGSNVDRYNFINNLFKLDTFDDLKSTFSKRLKDYELQSSKLEANIEEYNKYKLEFKQYKREYKELNNNGNIIDYSNKIEELKEKKSKYEVYKSNKLQLKQVGIKVDKLESKLSNLIKTLKLKNNKVNSKYISKLILDYKLYKNNIKKIQDIKNKINVLNKKKDNIKSNNKLLLQKIKSMIKTIINNKNIDNILEMDNIIESEFDKIKDEMNALNLEFKQYNKMIKTNGKCPICGAKIDLVKFKKKIKNIKLKYKECKSKYNSFNSIKDLILNYKDKQQEYKKLLNTKKEYKKELQSIDLNNNNNDNRFDRNYYSKLQNISSLLEDKKTLQESIRYIEGNTIKYPKFTIKDEKILKKLDKKQQLYIENIVKLNQLKSNIDMCRCIMKDNNKKEEYDKIREFIFIYKALIKAYSNKGIRTKAIKDLCFIFETNLNHYANIIYSENFKFKVNLDKNSISILVSKPSNNKNNDNIEMYDVRTLSGAESRFFILSSILSLMSMLKQKTDYIILDEADSNMDSTNSRYYYNKFLPALNKIVPKVICITTKDYIPDYSYKEVIVTKNKGESSILCIQK